MDDLSDATAEATALSTQLRDVAVNSRAALASITDGARASRTALRETSDATRTLSSAFKSSLGTAFRSATQDGAKLSDVLKGLALNISQSIANSAVSGLSNQLGGALGSALGGLIPFARGAVFDGGSVRRFAAGGIVTGPTSFPMKDGHGLMGEAGPEAIMPLKRGPDGRLGIAGGAGPTVNVTIHTQDADSFARSRSQISATLARAVSRGQRNL